MVIVIVLTVICGNLQFAYLYLQYIYSSSVGAQCNNCQANINVDFAYDTNMRMDKRPTRESRSPWTRAIWMALSDPSHETTFFQRSLAYAQRYRDR